MPNNIKVEKQEEIGKDNLIGVCYLGKRDLTDDLKCDPPMWKTLGHSDAQVFKKSASLASGSSRICLLQSLTLIPDS